MARSSSLAVHPRDLVLRALRKSKQPLTAYGLLDQLHDKGVKSPMIVYRALADLEKAGTVHKIHAIGAYVACNCHSTHDHSLSVLTLCQQCKRVEELHDHGVISHLEKLRAMQVNIPEGAVIELPVLCEQCRA